MSDKIIKIISGASSGLGRYLLEHLGGVGFARGEFSSICSEQYNDTVIIHSAFNSTAEISESMVYDYLSDNIFLTEKLITLPHKKYIFISTIDVYKNNKNTSEENELSFRENLSLYAFTKLSSEAIVRKKSKNHLILRCSTLLGPYSRKSNIIRMLTEENCKLSIDSRSSFNCVLHRDIADFIEYAIRHDLQGTYNLASTGNITLGEVASIFNKKVTWGVYNYYAGNLDNKKIISVFPQFNKTSRDVVLEFYNEIAGVKL